MKNFKVFTILIVMLIVAGISAASSQSMEIMDSLIAQETAEYGESIYLIAVGSGTIDGSASVSDAMSAAAENKWISGKADPDSAITAGELSLAAMKAFDMKGGIMYMLFKSPRYAARELAFLELLPRAHTPDIISAEPML